MSRIAENKIKHGHIYLVEEDIYIAQRANKSPGAKGAEIGIRAVIIPKGELLEFRYHSPAHFRDIYNNYFPVDDRQLGKLKAVAEIWEKVVRQNQAELGDILRLCLYDELEYNRGVRVVNSVYLDRANALKSHLERLEVYEKI